MTAPSTVVIGRFQPIQLQTFEQLMIKGEMSLIAWVLHLPDPVLRFQNEEIVIGGLGPKYIVQPFPFLIVQRGWHLRWWFLDQGAHDLFELFWAIGVQTPHETIRVVIPAPQELLVLGMAGREHTEEQDQIVLLNRRTESDESETAPQAFFQKRGGQEKIKSGQVLGCFCFIPDGFDSSQQSMALGILATRLRDIGIQRHYVSPPSVNAAPMT